MSKTEARATIEDLYHVSGKAELIRGRIVEHMATGDKPSQVAGNIYASLRDHSKKTKQGVAYPDNTGFTVHALMSGRESFSPDASFHRGPWPVNRMRFIEAAPTFGVEVRSECDYLSGAEAAMADKRTDYFEAGTLVVWDVDTEAECVHVYLASDPEHPITFRRGQMAHAEPAVPGWRISIDDVFWMPDTD